MAPPCCPHPVTRHAYNGCANCGCAVRWIDHPDRDADPELPSINATRARMGLPPVGGHTDDPQIAAAVRDLPTLR